MELWNKLVKDGKRATNSHQLFIAHSKYEKALERSKFLYYRWHNKIESVNCITVSYQLISENLITQGSLEPACNYLFQGHQLLSSLSSFCHEESDYRVPLQQAKSQIASSISEIVSKNSEIDICEGCYLRIFGIPQSGVWKEFFAGA